MKTTEEEKKAERSAFLHGFTHWRPFCTPRIVVNSNKAHASMAFLAPIGVVIGEALLSHLIAASAAVVIAGVTYIVATKVASKLRNKCYDHYATVIRKGDVYI
ncbi:hypothetical protein HNR34_001084 [Geobacillus subterraneus]